MAFNGSALLVPAIPFSRSNPAAFPAGAVPIWPDNEIVLGKGMALLTVREGGEVFGSSDMGGGHVIEMLFAQYFLGRPAIAKAPDQGIAGNAELSCPLSERQALAAKFYDEIIPLVVGLDLNRCPDAIFTRVVAVVINALNGVTARTFAHLREKAFKSLPVLTDLDASRAIFLVGRIIRILASTFHPHPNSVGASSGFAMRCLAHGANRNTVWRAVP